MFCPKCGTNQSEELKFCKSCGSNLSAVRQAVTTREKGEKGEKFDWNKTWLTEMFLSDSERRRRKEESDRELGITPDYKRRREIKAGVITASAGVAVAIFLAVFMRGIILGGEVTSGQAEIISRLWVVGVIPFCVGLGLMINGLFVSRFGSKRRSTGALDQEPQRQALPSADATDFIPSGLSVTEQTTRELRRPEQNQ